MAEGERCLLCGCDDATHEAVWRKLAALEKDHQRLQALVAKLAPNRLDPRIREFLVWFQAEYRRRRHGADYLVKWAKHGALVKQMLGATDLDRLKTYSQIMLSDKCEDEFVMQSDRGIEVLSVKFNWLSERYAAWCARRQEMK